MEQTVGEGRREGGSGGGGGDDEGGFDRAYSIGGGKTEEEERGNEAKGEEGGGANRGGSSSGGASAKQEVSHGAKEVEEEAGGGKPGDQLVPAIPYTRPPPLDRQAQNYTVVNLNGTRIELRNRWRRAFLDYRLWCFNNSDKRYEFGHENRKCCALPSKGHFFIYMHYNGKWLCAAIDGPSGYLFGYVTRSVGEEEDVRACENSEAGEFIEHAKKLPYDGGYESEKLVKCGDLVHSFVVMYRHVERQERAPQVAEVIRAGETFILHFTEAGKNDELNARILDNFMVDNNPVGNEAYTDARNWKTSCGFVYNALGIKDEEHGEEQKDIRRRDKSKRMTTAHSATKAKAILKDVRLLHRPNHKRGYLLLSDMPMQLSKDGPVDPLWAEEELRKSHQLDLDNTNWGFLTKSFPQFPGTSIDGSMIKLLENAYMKTEDIVAEKLVAYHESGHAIVALHTPGARPIQKVTILPQGSFLGMISQVAAQDNASTCKKQILASLDICLGGRVAQELIYGEQCVRAGAERDLITARELAHNMVSNYGISDTVDLVHVKEVPSAGEMQAQINVEVSNYWISDTIDPVRVKELPSAGEMLERTNAEVDKLLRESYKRVKLLLEKHVRELEAVTNALLEKKTLAAHEILSIVHLCQNFQGGEQQ